MIDQYGLIVQENGDGGDCPCRSGIVLACHTAMNGRTSLVMLFAKIIITNLKLPGGQWVRYPVTYAVPSDFSRDQASRLMLGLGYAGYAAQIEEYYAKLIRNWLRHPNGDFLGIGEVSNFIRLSNLWTCWPLLAFLDLNFLWSVLVAWRLNPWDADNLFIADLWLAQQRLGTPYSWLARQLYDKNKALARLTKNLADPEALPDLRCREAYEANCWFLRHL